MERITSTNLIETLQSLEETFSEAGQLALTMQEDVNSYNKRETGNPTGDIVTEADLAVQEALLKEIGKTSLVGCCLLAEEDTPSTKSFNPDGKFYLGIDPIDDTAIYAKGGQHFSTIITLHDGKNVLYTFVYFPAWDWTHTIVENKYSVSGETPDLPLIDSAEKSILYWSGSPEKNLPYDVLEELKRKDISFMRVATIKDRGVGSIGMFAANRVAGVYHEDMNAYDGMVEFAIATAKGQKTYSGGPQGRINLSDIRTRESGLYYQGHYLALNSAS